MVWVLLKIKDRSFPQPPPPPPPPSPPAPPPPPPHSQSHTFNSNHSVNPNILLIIIILAIIFFISGLLHLLVRFLLRPQIRVPAETDEFTALQGQLQHLFHLHDSGVDQSFIDTLPLFNYKALIGPKNPFDCAVCLSEFEPEDELRLLPNCSHAFHTNCIDTWLLSHSTCPICRAILAPDFSHATNFSPVVRVLESGNGSFRDDDDDASERSGETEIEVREREIVAVKLGKYRSVVVDDGGGNGSGGGTESSVSAERRCFSMGSFAYVMEDNSSLKVPISMKKRKLPRLPLGSNHRTALSECGSDSRREFNGVEAFKILEIRSRDEDDGTKFVTRCKRESFSVSKIWLRGKRDKPNAGLVELSRRAFSSRFPMQRNPTADQSESNGENRLDSDCEANTQSFGRRTLQWLIGRQDKVVESSFTSNV
ncbi:hypothetical protein ABFX02_11G028200 [Erythranthe guttata]